MYESSDAGVMPFRLMMRRPFVMPLVLLGGALVLFPATWWTKRWKKKKKYGTVSDEEGGGGEEHHHSHSHLPTLAYGLVKTMTAFGALAALWFLFGVIVRLRNHTRTAAGSTYMEDNWGFGQVLALTTWIPLIVQFVSTGVRFSDRLTRMKRKFTAFGKKGSTAVGRRRHGHGDDDDDDNDRGEKRGARDSPSAGGGVGGSKMGINMRTDTGLTLIAADTIDPYEPMMKHYKNVGMVSVTGSREVLTEPQRLYRDVGRPERPGTWDNV